MNVIIKVADNAGRITIACTSQIAYTTQIADAVKQRRLLAPLGSSHPDLLLTQHHPTFSDHTGPR